jgi:hypothetical protein
MSNELQQSVMNVAGKNGAVVSATFATVFSGIAGFFEVIQPLIGSFTSMLALCITYLLFRKKDKLLTREIELKDAQIKAIGERKQGRGDEQ